MVFMEQCGVHGTVCVQSHPMFLVLMEQCGVHGTVVQIANSNLGTKLLDTHDGLDSTISTVMHRFSSEQRS